MGLENYAYNMIQGTVIEKYSEGKKFCVFCISSGNHRTFMPVASVCTVNSTR